MILKTQHLQITIKITLFVLFNIIIFYSCTEAKATKEKDNLDKKVYLAEKNEVAIMVLKNESFQKELVSNGKLIATQKNSLKFEVSEKLERLHVKNGSEVKKNQVLASLNKFKVIQVDAKLMKGRC